LERSLHEVIVPETKTITRSINQIPTILPDKTGTSIDRQINPIMNNSVTMQVEKHYTILVLSEEIADGSFRTVRMTVVDCKNSD
jgi:hypothetical protein